MGKIKRYELRYGGVVIAVSSDPCIAEELFWEYTQKVRYIEGLKIYIIGIDGKEYDNFIFFSDSYKDFKMSLGIYPFDFKVN